jgi:hypothetical protein
MSVQNVQQIVEFVKVEAGDVDGSIYFNENVGKNVRLINYYDSNGLFKKRDCFAYCDIGGDKTNVCFMYSSSLDNFLGAWGSNLEPDKTGLQKDSFYYIATPVTISGVSYEKKDILGLVDVGYKVLKWKKCSISREGTLVEV